MRSARPRGPSGAGAGEAAPVAPVGAGGGLGVMAWSVEAMGSAGSVRDGRTPGAARRPALRAGEAF